jgi:acetyl-CoA carboxylase biotin carboxyl carrier protein
MTLTDEDVREILRIIDETPLAEFHVETDDFTLHVTRHMDGGEPSAPPRASTGGAEGSPPSTKDVVMIEAPMLGVFYAADAPGEEPFVKPGSRVEPDTTVCIIEVMKMMNSVPAGVSGTVIEVCKENGDMVKEGEPLFRIAP